MGQIISNNEKSWKTEVAYLLVGREDWRWQPAVRGKPADRARGTPLVKQRDGPLIRVRGKPLGANSIYSIQIGFREIMHAYPYSQQSKKLRFNCVLQIFLMKLWVKRTSIKTEKLFGLGINTEMYDCVNKRIRGKPPLAREIPGQKFRDGPLIQTRGKPVNGKSMFVIYPVTLTGLRDAVRLEEGNDLLVCEAPNNVKVVKCRLMVFLILLTLADLIVNADRSKDAVSLEEGNDMSACAAPDNVNNENKD